MADLSNVTFQPQNPDALFSPDQWLNKFSLFNDKALPWPSSYTGYPTDAMGNFITPQAGSDIPTQAQWQAGQAARPAATPGTTINSTPAAATAAPDNTALRNYITQQNATLQGMPSSLNQGGFGAGNNVMSNTASAQIRDNAIALDQLRAQPQQQQQAPQAAAPGGLTYPQVLALLANPGKVTTPGASVPAGSSAQPTGGVNNAFLGQARPGMNQNFLSALAALQNRGRG